MSSTFKLNKLTLFISSVLLSSAFNIQADNTSRPLPVMQQIQQLPADFVEHLFDAPLVVRAELNGRYLGDAMVVLDRQENIQLLTFTDIGTSDYSDEQRQYWMQRLSNKTALGPCKTQCEDIIALHYNLTESLFSILSSDAQESVSQTRYYQPSSEGQHGLILQNHLSISGGQQQDTSGFYQARLTGSYGAWTNTASAQLTRSGGAGSSTESHLSDLYTQREFSGSFLRLGLFNTHNADLQLPSHTFSSSSIVTGIMYGSSSALEIPGNTASATPVYVTANRTALVEIYRDGYLLHTQQVSAGLQLVDTTRLPGGIYPVQIKLIEDGKVSSETEEMIYKPNGWSNPEQRLKYNLFIGQPQSWSRSADANDNNWHAGVAANYLLTPRTIIGAGLNHHNDHLKLSLSADVSLSGNNRLLFSTFYSDDNAHGINTQLIYGLKNGSLILGHNQQWHPTNTPDSVAMNNTKQTTATTSLSMYQRLNHNSSVNLRLTRDHENEYGVDANWSYRQQVLGNDALWRLTGYNRPGTDFSNGKRDYGIELGVTINFGSNGNRYHAALGNRSNRNGEREFSANIGWDKSLQHGFFQSIGATASLDSHGAGLSGHTAFQNQYLEGNGFMNRSSYNGNIGGGLNLSSTVAIGDNSVAATSQGSHAQAGVIVELQSDIGDIELQADNGQGNITVLKPGKNFVAVSPYAPGRMSFSLPPQRADNIALSNGIISYQLNPGTVKTVTLAVHETLSVMGRLTDNNSQPLKGHHIINHASRTVSEVSGFFSVEMRKNSPTLDIVYQGELLCQINLAERLAEQEDDILLLGDIQLSCPSSQMMAANTGN